MRERDHVVRVPIVASADGPMLRPESLGPMLPIEVHRDAGIAYTLEVWGARLQLEPGVAVVRVGNDVRPLATRAARQERPTARPAAARLRGLSGRRSEHALGRRDVAARGLHVASAGGARSVAPARDARETPPRRVVVPAVAWTLARPTTRGCRRCRRSSIGRTIIVDAGHGGVDNGMTGPLGGGPKIYEKNITLAVATKLGDQLESRGVDVVYTRTTRHADRARRSRQDRQSRGGDLFISIHVNAANPNWKDPRGSRGFETYFLSEAKTEDARRVEQMENDAVQVRDDARTRSTRTIR